MMSRLRKRVVLLALAALPAALAQVSFAEPRPARTPAVVIPPRPSAPPPAASGSASASGSAPSPAPAPAPASAPTPSSLAAEIMVLHASNTGGGIDPRIGNMPQLKKPPFSSYDTYRFMERSRSPLAPGRPVASTLPNGRVMQIVLKETLPRGRFKVAASVQSNRGNSFLPLLEVTTSLNENFFVAGQSYQDGVLVVGIKLVK
jgi:hypothetical protein